MQLDQNTTQADLQKLYRIIVRREFLKGTPLNIKAFLRYSLLFLLFPGMIFGYWVGFAITAVFCLVLIVMMSLDQMNLALICTFTWFSLALLPVCYVTWKTYSRAARTKALRLMQREPLGANPAKAIIPHNTPLKWHNLRRKHNTLQTASIVINAPQDGVYVLLLTIPTYNGGRLLTDGPAGMCIMQKQVQKGQELNALQLYNLKQGAHEICWSFGVDEQSSAPEAFVTQIICKTENPNV